MLAHRGLALVAGALVLTTTLAGCIGGDETVDLNALAGLDVAVSPESGDASTAFTFDASRTPGADGLAFAWDFGDGETATGAVVTHTFLYTNNLYRVAVTASAGNQTLSDVVEVPVGSGENTPPTLDVQASARWVGHGDALALNASTSDADGDPIAIEWLLSKNMAEGGGHQHAPGEEHDDGGAGDAGFGIPDATGKTGPTATFTFDESGTYRITARALDPKGGRTDSAVDVKVTQTVPKTTFDYIQEGELVVGTAGAGASLIAYDLLQPSQNTFIDAARYDVRLLYAGSGTLSIAWNGSAAPADLDVFLRDEAGQTIVALDALDPTAMGESAEVELQPGGYTIEVRANAGVLVPYTLSLSLELVVPGLNDAPHDDGHDHEH